jgi:hypothetical protein
MYFRWHDTDGRPPHTKIPQQYQLKGDSNGQRMYLNESSHAMGWWLIHLDQWKTCRQWCQSDGVRTTSWCHINSETIGRNHMRVSPPINDPSECDGTGFKGSSILFLIVLMTTLLPTEASAISIQWASQTYKWVPRMCFLYYDMVLGPPSCTPVAVKVLGASGGRGGMILAYQRNGTTDSLQIEIGGSRSGPWEDKMVIRRTCCPSKCDDISKLCTNLKHCALQCKESMHRTIDVNNSLTLN